MRTFRLTLLLVLLAACNFLSAQTQPKREFRGAWIQTVFQGQYASMSPAQMKRYFINTLDELEKLHINAIVFQVRPEADAWYDSKYEPWSRFLTGKQGRAPEGDFDPMAFMIEECHKRNMEFHAWLNPYRAAVNESLVMDRNHVYYKHPEWFVKYGRQTLFDPGVPECREYICTIVKDIVSRYDVDAIHMDDYFYPYPVGGEDFPDQASFARYGRPKGYKNSQKNAWRRNNVNMLIQEIRMTMFATKPWVRFGVSPFGIYRNKKSTTDGSGSNTNGLQNYDDLYADVKKWVKEGWIDYNIPQVYWEIGHNAADYVTLVKWWAENNYNQHLYIGQDVARTMKADDLTRKMRYIRRIPQIHGNCFWPAGEITANNKGVVDSLANNYHRYPALIPAYTHLHNRTPKDVKKLKAKWTENGYVLQWKQNGKPQNPETGAYYVVYRFKDKEKVNLEDPSKIVKITRDTYYQLPYNTGKTKYKYVVTSVDKFHNESKKGKSKTVKL